MSRGRTLVALGVASALVGLLGGCEVNPSVDERRFRVSFVDSGPNTSTVWRSQDPPDLQEWDGTPNLHYLQLVASASVSALVTPAGGSGPIPGGTIVWLDAPAQSADVSGVVESNNVFGQLVVPGVYDVLVAPGALLVGQPAARFEGVPLTTETPESNWELQSTVAVLGDVQVASRGRGGSWIVPYPRGFEGLPLGTWAESRPDGSDDDPPEGSFEIRVPEGVYDVVVAPALREQPDTGILQPDPVAPAFLAGRDWPILPVLDPPLRQTIAIPALPTTTLVGRVVGASLDVTAVSRVRIEGAIAARVVGGESYPGGTWIAEMRTDGEGVFRCVVPLGSYTVTATPDFADRTRDVGVVRFEARGGELLDLQVPLSVAPIGTVAVLDEDGVPVPGATLFIRNQRPPRYAYGERTRPADDANAGYWFGTLMRGVYDVEVVPPTDPDTGEKVWARAHGVLDLSEGNNGVVISLRPSAIMSGSVFSRDGRSVDDVQVILRDPETGLILDETTTNRTTDVGFFRAILPETGTE